MDIEAMIQEIKETVMELGAEEVSEVLGYATAITEDTEYQLEEAFDQMFEEDINILYNKYCMEGGTC